MCTNCSRDSIQGWREEGKVRIKSERSQRDRKEGSEGRKVGKKRKEVKEGYNRRKETIEGRKQSKEGRKEPIAGTKEGRHTCGFSDAVRRSASRRSKRSYGTKEQKKVSFSALFSPLFRSPFHSSVSTHCVANTHNIPDRFSCPPFPHALLLKPYPRFNFFSG
jgi:hypothetical protein